ncbi:DUF1684 domain-containing protein [Brooklawnia cerclae]|uniref:DUF1684 domain-containing protein n=1 Tax=Brooklawnia cerclae TaxID=349934 RepID=A0ABX0SMY7_9ACTN|nr:DUF1684 domain-containing protein [Brooklawnia cerclae]NIH58688.1 hypothetical protein [Brooklawnia cerclae]
MGQEGYAQTWEQWHTARKDDLNSRHGWLSLVSQDWLEEGIPLSAPGVPGQWLLSDGTIWYLPPETALDPHVLVDGVPALERIPIPLGRNKNAGHGSSVPIAYGELAIEVIVRKNSLGRTIYAVRVRDPQEAARRRLDDLDAFPPDEEWIVPASFEPSGLVPFDAPTVEDGVYEASSVVGTLRVRIAGADHELTVSGRRDAAGALVGYVHFTDQTNGTETYGAGRIVTFAAGDLDHLTALDLNRAVSFPCAFTNYVTCPLPPATNRLALRVTAGEKAPRTRVDRIQTYSKQPSK